MLAWYMGERMVSITNINIGIKESTHGYQNCNICQILISGGYLKMRESLLLSDYLNILNHIDTRAILPR